MRLLTTAALALASSLALPASAAADHGNVSVSLSLRYGPSMEYRRITVIPDGRRVYVRRCTPGYRWCEVRYGRHIGWVRARYVIHPRYGRPYSYLDARLSLPLFDFFGHISDFDRDRRYRYRRHRHGDAYYHNLRRRHRGHRGWRDRHHRRGHHRRHRDWDDDDRKRRRHRRRHRDRDNG